MTDFKARSASSVLRSAALFLGISFVGIVHGQAIQPVEGGPVHEAFVTPVTENVALEATEAQPPSPITERIPPKPNPEVEWVVGYWAWAPERKDFLWVSGVWRRPPPGRHWISGVWKLYDEGWVWVRGFWSELPDDSLTTIDIAPPDQLDEAVPPEPGNGFFWMSGYWGFSETTHSYLWRSGHWIELDPNWVLVPAHYVWRPGGYVFVSAYWDWPIEQRGRAYATVYVPPPVRVEVVYEPVVVIEPAIIVHNLFIYYPDYSYFFYHHHHYHTAFWIQSGDAPPWWGWNRWWCFTWHDHWAMWWWYTHPGYPHPAWITVELAGRIPPPPRTLVAMVKVARPPTIITVQGMVAPSKILRAATQNKPRTSKGTPAPVLPADPQRAEKIKASAKAEEVGVSKPVAKPLLPSGRKIAQTQQKGIEKQAIPAKPTTTSTILPNQPKTKEAQKAREGEKLEPKPPIRSVTPTVQQPNQTMPKEKEKPETAPAARPPIKKPSEPAAPPSEPKLQEREKREPSAEVKPPIKRPVAPATKSLQEPLPRVKERPELYRTVEPPPKPAAPRGSQPGKPALRENERPQASPAGPPSRQLTSPPTSLPTDPNTNEKEKLK